jgi:hypothetical protein
MGINRALTSGYLPVWVKVVYHDDPVIVSVRRKTKTVPHLCTS